MEHPNEKIPALGVHQPWAELILRGVKTLEIRSAATRMRGVVFLYASRRLSSLPEAQRAMAEQGLVTADLVVGHLVGTVEIVGSRPFMSEDAVAACVSAEGRESLQAWVLANPQRLPEPLWPRFLPYGVWFYPFRRRQALPGKPLDRR